MKIRPFFLLTIVIFFLDVLSFGACSKKDKGCVYIHFMYEAKYNTESIYYKELGTHNKLDGFYRSTDIVEYDLINDLFDDLKAEREENDILSALILDFYYLSHSDNLEEWEPIEENEKGIVLNDDMISGYYQGIRGAYHIMVLLELSYEE